MDRPAFLLAGLLAALPGPALQAAEPTERALSTAENLREIALRESDAWSLLASLTTEVGPRPAGSSGDRAAVAWALATLGEFGFDSVHPQTVIVPAWERGEASLRIIQPHPQDLLGVALGHTVGTPEEGIRAPVLRVDSIEALEALTPDAVRGHVVFIDKPMARNREGSGYDETRAVRTKGPSLAGERGAVAAVIRSVGSSGDRFAHTGMTRFEEGVRPIPAFALAFPDADMLARQLASGAEVELELKSTARMLPPARSANVVGEIRGRERPGEFVLMGAHLDSWDLGTGAVDDGAGVAIVAEAARLIASLPVKPARSIRVVLFANEEAGLDGAKAYQAAAARAGERHVIGIEADLGGAELYELRSGVGEAALPMVDAMAGLLEPLGIARGDNTAKGGADLKPLREAGMPVLDLRHDAAHYFDWHHTANDTLDKVDPDALRQAVAAYAVVAWLAADAAGDFGMHPGVPSEDETDAGRTR